MRTRVPIVSLNLILLSSAGMPVYAQDKAAAADILEEVIVSAERRTESLQNVPISAAVFDSETLEKARITEAKDYLQFTPNIAFSEDGQVGPRGVQIAIRGVGNVNLTNAPQATSIGYYIDDLNVGTVAGGTINPQLQDMERIEVLRGPQGTFFGRNALGGAISISTKKPDADPYYEVGAGYGRFDTYGVYGVGNLPFTDNFFARAVLAYDESGGTVKNVNPAGTPDSGWENQSGRLALRYLVSDALTIDLSHSFSKEDAGLDATVNSGEVDLDTKQTLNMPNLAAIPEGLGFFPHNQRYVNHGTQEYNRNEVGITNLRINYGGSGYSLASITGYIDSENGRRFDQDLISADIFIRLNRWHANSFSQELRLQSDDSNRFNWIVGATYARDRIFQFNNIFVGHETTYTNPETGVTTRFLPPFVTFGFPLNLRNEQLTTKSLALFAEGTYEINDQWAITLGGRQTRDEVTVDQFGELAFNRPRPDASGNRTFNNFAPRLVVKYKVNPDVSTYATLSSGYRAGGVDINGGVITKFDPEELRNYELGVKTTLADRRARLNVAVFYLDWKDLQVQTGYLADPTDISSSIQKTLNASSADSIGAEVELQALPLTGLAVGLGVGYLDGKFKEFPDAIVFGGATADLSGRRLPKSAKWSLSGSAQYTMPLPMAADAEAFMRLEGTYRSSVAGNLNASVAPLVGLPDFPYQEPSYAVVNLRLGGSTEHWRAEGYVENLLERDYYNGTFDHFGLGGIRLKPHPRTYGVRFVYKSK